MVLNKIIGLIKYTIKRQICYPSFYVIRCMYDEEGCYHFQMQVGFSANNTNTYRDMYGVF